MLDIVFDDNPYPQICEIPIDKDFLVLAEPITQIRVPTINSIAGDKLTAFAPNTIGIKYNCEKELQIIKQLYDIGKLFLAVNDLKIVSDSYKAIAATQLRYHNISLPIDNILSDTINTAFLLGMQNKNENADLTMFSELAKGVNSLNSFLPGGRYHIHNAIEDASRAALLAASIKQGVFNPLPFIRREDYDSLQYTLPDCKYSPLNKMLKKLPNLSAFYWSHVVKLL